MPSARTRLPRCCRRCADRDYPQANGLSPSRYEGWQLPRNTGTRKGRFRRAGLYPTLKAPQPLNTMATVLARTALLRAPRPAAETCAEKLQCLLISRCRLAPWAAIESPATPVRESVCQAQPLHPLSVMFAQVAAERPA